MKKKTITERKEDYSKWYSDVIDAADFAEHSSVRGCMIIKPYGYALWEIIQQTLDKMLKDIGVVNAYFPIFIPDSFLKRETKHIEGFSPELAVVTHAGGKKLEEPLIVRPTSETIIYEAFSKWIQSYRDLPFVVNQWANVVRWELRPRLFLRTTEFLWQEGHTAHATAEEAETYALRILKDIYKRFAEEYLAIPVYAGKKSEREKFAGAYQTFCIEAIMQDGKSLQMGTAHDLSDNFARSFNVSFLDKTGSRKYAYQSSWGVSTRLIGGIVMAHGDDKGIILPPKIAPIQVIIIPISKNENAVIEKAVQIKNELSKKFRVEIDMRTDLRPGEKYYEWEKKGVPVRIEIGPRDIIQQSCVLARRDTFEKISYSFSALSDSISKLLDEIHYNLYEKASKRANEMSIIADNWETFIQAINQGGYVFVHWCETDECEAAIKEKTKATSRCHYFDAPDESGNYACFHCGKKVPSGKRWIFARAY